MQRKYAFARLKENIHLGELDNKGVQFLFLMIEPEETHLGPEETNKMIAKMDMARAMSLIVNQETVRDKLIISVRDKHTVRAASFSRH